MRHEMRANAQATIARCWMKFDGPKQVARLLVDKEKSASVFWGGEWQSIETPMHVMIPDTADIMEYCVKVLSGRENPNYWKGILKEVEYEMWINQYSGGPGAEYMSRVDDAFMVLINKFKYSPKWEEFQSRYYGY